MDKNTLIAIVVIFLMVFLFQFIFLKPQIERKSQESATQLTEEQQKEEEAPISSGMLSEEEAAFVTPQDAEEKIIKVETKNYIVNISTQGGSIVSLKLKNYLDKDGKPLELVEYKQNDMLPFEVHFARLRNLNSDRKTLYLMQKEGENIYTFFRDFKDRNGNLFRFSKTYIFQDDEYIFDLQLRLKSMSDEEVYLNNDGVSYTMIWGPVLGPISVIKNRYNITTQGYHENGKFHKVLRGAGGCSLRRSENRYEEVSKIVDWVGITNRYFFISIIPDTKNYIYAFDQRTEGKFYVGISHPYFKGDEFQDNFKVYAGPKERKLLKNYGYNFESVMGGKVLKPIVIFLEWMIILFHRFTGNYGLAIVLMTITIKIILHPLTRKSFESMRRMSALQPKINELREKYKNNPQQLNKETTALYRREKVNPMGGCLPMILQLPIFYGLYSVLSSLIALRNESFLWIKDLSLPDTIATIKFSIPFLGYRLGSQGFTDINILPFIMTGTTLLQSKLTSGNQSGQQGKMMTYMFPIVFFFIFWNMPSGLVLYWTIQNILTIGQQYYIDYRLKRKIPEPVKVKKGEKGPVKKKRH